MLFRSASPLAGVPFITVVTDTSARRQAINGEGLWTRPAITRRQMEDVSLALADAAFAFGPRGESVARAGRVPGWDAVVVAPRQVPASTLEALDAAAAGRSGPAAGVQVLLNEPQDPASGVMAALDAAAELRRRGASLERPIVSIGPNVVFAPLKPREFMQCWSSRGFVRELISEQRWTWTAPGDTWSGPQILRLYPSAFEHLPSVWHALAQGALPLLSPAATEGLAPGARLPHELLLADEPDAAGLADAIQQLHSLPASQLESLRRRACSVVAAAHRGPARAGALDAVVNSLRALLRARPTPPPLGQAARLFLDRTRPLRELAAETAATAPSAHAHEANTLSVVVVCYNMGPLITQTVESVWASQRMPDEVLLIDDGSDDPETLSRLAALEEASRARRLPLRLIRQRNAGLSGARNAGLAAATGTFISFIDGDDLIEPPFYGLAVEVMRRNPELGGVGAWALCFGEGVPDGFWNAPQPEFPLMFAENTVIVPCLMRTAVVRDLGGFDPRQRFSYEDWDFFTGLIASGRPIVIIPRYLQRYRVRPDSMLRAVSDVQNQLMREQILSKHRDTVSRFAVETALQVEHRLMRRIHSTQGAAATNGHSRWSKLVRRLLAWSA